MKYILIIFLGVITTSCEIGNIGPDAYEEHLQDSCKSFQYSLDSKLYVSDGRILACSRNFGDSIKWGFIVDKNCREFLPFVFDKARNFENGLAPVAKGKMWGAIDTTGKIIIPFKYYNLHKFFDSLSTFVDSKNKWGVITVNQDTIIKPEYQYISDFFSNVSFVQNNDLSWNIVNSKGVMLPIKIDSLDKTIYDSINDHRNFPFDYRLQITGQYLYFDKVEVVVMPIYTNGKRQKFVAFNNQYALMPDSVHIGIIRTESEYLSKIKYSPIF